MAEISKATLWRERYKEQLRGMSNDRLEHELFELSYREDAGENVCVQIESVELERERRYR